MEEIIEKLKTIKDDIQFDVTNNLVEGVEKERYIFQYRMLVTAIATLEYLGENKNIKN